MDRKLLISLLSPLVEDDSLPELQFTNQGGLNMTIKHLAAADPEGEASRPSTEALTRAVTVTSLVDSAVHPLSQSIAYQDFHKVADAFATKLQRGYSVLRGLRPQVDDIVKVTLDRADDECSCDPVLAQLLNHPTTKTPLMPVLWQLLDKYGEHAIRQAVELEYELPSTEAIDPASVGVVIARQPFANESLQPKLQSVDIPLEKADLIVDKVDQKLHGSYPRRAIKHTLNAVFNLDDYKCKSFLGKLRMMHRQQGTDDINKFLMDIDRYTRILPLLTPETLDLSASSQEEIDKHMDILAGYVKAGAYLACHYRRNLWKDAILVPGNYVNLDNWDKYTAKGGNKLQLLQHKQHFYGQDQRLPASGIDYKFVLSQADNVQGMAQESLSLNLEQVRNNRKRILRDRYIDVACEWLEGHRNYFCPAFGHQGDLRKFAAATYDNHQQEPLENMAYNLILESCYSDTLPHDLYHRLNEKYVEYGKKLGKLDDKQCEIIEANIAGEMVCDFLFDTGIVKLAD